MNSSQSFAALRAASTPIAAGVFVLYARKSTEGEDRQVQSIDDQTRHCQMLADAQNLDITYSIAEAHSAKRHGTRPGFREMIEHIEAGEADGILAWHPDRLARNAIDGGWILDLLDRGKLRHLRFATYTFENTPEGKMMLGMIFSQAKYQVDKLSVDVRRGMDTKRDRGWFPHFVCEGYINDVVTHTVTTDPVRFPLLRQAIELILAGTHRPSEALRILNNDWGYRTRQTKRGGRPLSSTGFYHMLSNPFYYGECREKGIYYQGAHQALISRAEFRQIRARLANTGKQKPKLHAHPFTGLIRCGRCGAAVTASRVKGHVYYHCTNRLGVCTKAGVRGEALEEQFLAYFDRLSIPTWLEPELVQVVCRNLDEEPDRAETAEVSRQAALAAAQKQQRGLTGMRLRELLTDAEYLEERTRLQDEIERLERAGRTDDHEAARHRKTAARVVSYAAWARQSFLDAEPAEQRRLAGLLGEKLLLADRRLSVDLNPYLALLTEYHDALLAIGEALAGGETLSGVTVPGEENLAGEGLDKGILVNKGISANTWRSAIKPGKSGTRSNKNPKQAPPVPLGLQVHVQTVKIGSGSTKKVSFGETILAGSPTRTTFKPSAVQDLATVQDLEIVLEEVGAALARCIAANAGGFEAKTGKLL